MDIFDLLITYIDTPKNFFIFILGYCAGFGSCLALLKYVFPIQKYHHESCNLVFDKIQEYPPASIEKRHIIKNKVICKYIDKNKCTILNKPCAFTKF